MLVRKRLQRETSCQRAIVARCLEKVPADRYPSVDALADAPEPFRGAATHDRE